MRKTLSKEVTSTTVSIAKMEMVDGAPQAVVLPSIVLLGNVSMEKAQKEVHKSLGKDVSVFSIEAKTEVYEMPIEDFIKVASLKVETVTE